MTKNISKQKKDNIARVFFALWPEPAVQKQLGQVAQTLKPLSEGRAVQTQNIHLTLTFLGNVIIDRLPELKIAASHVTARTFSFLLQDIGYWKRNKIIYVSAKQFPQELYQLVAHLRDSLSENGFKFDQQSFKPHITLLRQAKHATKIDLDLPIQWHVKKWCLIQSKLTPKGTDYIPLDCWPLTSSN